MDFTFSEEQQSIAASCRELLDDISSPQTLRGAAYDERTSTRWEKLAELGLTGMLAPTEVGGMALDDVDFILVAQEIGRAALPEALVEHAGIAVPMLASLLKSSRADRPVEASADIHSRVADWLERAASGEARITVGASCNPFVLDAANADALLLAAGDEVHLVDRVDVRLARQVSIDPLRALSAVEWTPHPHTCIASGSIGRAAWRKAEERGAIHTAAQCAGLAERMIDLAVEYAAQRTQFGKAIGCYQALKHQLATVRVKLEFARALIYSAVTRVADADARAFAAVSSAKLAAGDAAELAARTSLQVHGAMGYSSEVDLHIYMKRAWALLGSWGDRNYHARRVQSLLFEGGLPLGPDETFARLELG